MSINSFIFVLTEINKCFILGSSVSRDNALTSKIHTAKVCKNIFQFHDWSRCKMS